MTHLESERPARQRIHNAEHQGKSRSVSESSTASVHQPSDKLSRGVRQSVIRVSRRWQKPGGGGGELLSMS